MTIVRTAEGTARIAGVTLLVCFLLSAIARGVSESFAVFLLPLSHEFGWDRAEASSVYAVLMLSFGLTAPLVGRIFDVWGPRSIYAAGLGCLAVGLIAAGSLGALWQFYLCIGLLGGAGAGAVSLVPHSALLSRWYHDRLTTAIAAVSAAAGLGVLVLSPTVQLLIDAFGWRSAYRVLGVGCAVVLLLVLLLPWSRIAAGRPRRPTAGPPPRPAGAALGVRAALGTRAFWALFFVHFCTALGMFAINPQIVALLVEAGFEPLTAASAFGLSGIAATAGLLVFGWIADRLGRRTSATLSYAMTLGGFVLLGLLAEYPSEWLLGLFILVYGPSFGSRGPIISSIAADVFGRGPNLGTLIGAVSLGMGTGAAAGATIGGLLHDWSGGYTLTTAFAFAAVGIPVVLFWTVPELRRR